MRLATETGAVIANAVERDLLFPVSTRALHQRVFHLDDKKVRRWDGVNWVVDPIDYADVVNGPSTAAAFGNNTITTTGLTYGYNGGMAVQAGVPALIAAGTLALADNLVNYVERTYAGVVSSNTTGFTPSAIPMATVTTAAGAIASTVDYRTPATPVGVYPLATGEAGVASTLYPQGHVSRYGAVVDGATADDTPFAAAVVRAAAMKGRVTIAGGAAGQALKIAANQTIPASAMLSFVDGGAITIAAGKVLTIAGGLIDAPARQIFFGSGTVVFSAVPQQVIHPAWWGALTNNVADDAPAWNRAALALSPVGGSIRIPNGNTIIASSLNEYSNVEHIGYGTNSVVKVKSGLAAGVIMFIPSAVGITGGAIRNCAIDQRTDLYVSVGNRQCVSVDSTIGFTIQGVEFRNTETMAVWADTPTANPTKRLNVVDCRFIAYAGSAGTADGSAGAVSLFGAVWDTRVVDCHFEGFRDDAVAIQDSANGRPVRVTVGTSTFLNNNRRLAGSTPHPILIYGAQTSAAIGNVIDSSVASGIWAGSGAYYKLEGFTCTGNTILNAGNSPDSTVGVPIAGINVLGDRANSRFAEDVTITGNTIVSSLGNGIQAQDVVGLVVSGNTTRLSAFSGLSVAYCLDVAITGNTLLDSGTAASGVELNAITLFATSPTVTCDRVTITGNRLGDTRAGGARTTKYFLYMSGGANFGTIEFSGNNVQNCVNAGVGGAPPVTLYVRNNPGYNPVGISAQGLGASPWTYTNQSLSPMTVYISGGTVSAIAKGGLTIALATGFSFNLEPNEAFTITYSSAPVMRVDVH